MCIRDRVKIEDILGHDLFLYDRTPGTLWGVNEEFVSAPRLDDLQCAFSSMAVSYTHLDVYKRQALDREKRMQEAMLSIKKKFGKNAVLKGMNLQEGATARDRNEQIGGHKA